jgi:TatA/E family protein of Tat protein translocase
VFGSLGLPEILFILVLALLLFGPKRLPEIGRTIGKGLGEFRRATNDLRRSIETEIAIDDPPIRRPTAVPPTAAVAPAAPPTTDAAAPPPTDAAAPPAAADGPVEDARTDTPAVPR